jgi:hypothetical protein
MDGGAALDSEFQIERMSDWMIFCKMRWMIRNKDCRSWKEMNIRLHL